MGARTFSQPFFIHTQLSSPPKRPINGDRRRKIDGDVVNFAVYYEIDDDTSMHVLTLNAYGGEDVGSWVLLAPIEEAR
jgi:hypothetical protein